MQIKKAFVTGATGFVGFHIANSLIENGIEVRALVRKASKADLIERLKTIGAQVFYGDITQPASYAQALKGASYVFHCAAVHKVWVKDAGSLYKNNCLATRLLLDKAAEENVEQFVYISSIKTIGLYGKSKISDEGSKYNLWGIDGDYGRSKFLAENLLLKSKKNIAVKILNPSAVIGPADFSLTPTMELIYRFLKGKIKVFIDTSMGLVDGRDVGKAAVLAIQRAKEKEKYILCAKNITLKELFLRLSRLSGVPAPRLKVPYWLLSQAAYLNLGMSKLTGKSPLFSPTSLKIARLNPCYDGTKAERELGLKYRPIEETLADTVSWLKNNFEGAKI